MASTSFQPDWNWPEGLPGRWNSGHETNASQSTSSQPGRAEGTPPSNQGNSSSSQQRPQERRRRTHWGPRTCRICLEVVQPTFETPSDVLPSVLQGTPSVSYVSEDGGRLIRPCLCKGSQKYVHEGCLQAWRLRDPNSKRNYWQCPTCKYSYRLERMNWAHWISGATAQIALTLAIFLVTIFVLGFLADPIINAYLDPISVLSSDRSAYNSLYEDESGGWLEHFVKGLASLGLLGFAKFLLTLSPWHWFNMRGTIGIGGGRGRATGRDRMAQISWFAVVVGVGTFLWAVWKGVRAWSKRTLTRASERVMDVPLAAGEADDDEE